MVSVGTGLRKRGLGRATGWRATARVCRVSVLSIMDDCNNQVETVMQWLSRSPNARRIDGQIETLSGDLLAGAPLLRYLRYNVTLDADWTKKYLQLSFDQPTLDRLSEMDKPANMSALTYLGRKAAAIQVKSEHFQSEAMV